MLDQWWLLAAIGLLAGAFGTLIGVGGGFILVPVLIILMPDASALDITATSLAVVFLSSASGSIAYLRLKRVDVHSAARFAFATVPGAILGAVGTQWFPRQQFNVAFGVILLLGSLYLSFRPDQVQDPADGVPEGLTKRELTDARGTTYVYHFSMPVGMVLSMLVGFVSGLFGVGGGIIQVPVLNKTLNFPVHIATATSQATLCLMAFVTTLVHFAQGGLSGHYERIAILGLSAIAGAQIGAPLSNRIGGKGLIRTLALTLGVIAAKILWSSLTSA